MLGEGEQVECVILGSRRSGSRFVLCTSHRIIVESEAGRGQDPLTLPFHRTSAVLDPQGSVTLTAQEFGAVRTVCVEPAKGHEAETQHLLERIDPPDPTEDREPVTDEPADVGPESVTLPESVRLEDVDLRPWARRLAASRREEDPQGFPPASENDEPADPS